MNGFFFDQHALSALAQLILTLGITLYLSSLREKAPATRWFLLFFAAMVAFAGLSLVEATSVWVPRFYAVHLQLVAACLALVPLMQFAYRFPPSADQGDPPPRLQHEARLVFWLSLLMAGGAFALALGEFAQLRPTGTPTTTTHATDTWLVLGFAWVLLTFGRRTLVLSRQHCPTWRWWQCWLAPAGHAAQATRAFALVFLLPVLLTALTATSSYVDLFTEGVILDWVPAAGVLVSLFLIALVFVNHTTERTSVMAKLSAIVLLTLLLVIGLLGAVIAPTYQDTFPGLPDTLSARTFRFVPAPGGGYTVRTLASQFDPDLGEQKTGGALALPFPFPFYGQHQTDVELLKDGRLVFGSWSRWATSYNLRPAILLLDSDGIITQFVKESADRVVVTWQAEPRAIAPTIAQAVLYPDGRFDLTYQQFRASDLGRSGIQAGTGGLSIQPFELTREYAGEIVAGDGFFTDYRILQRQFLDTRMRPLVLTLMGVSLLVVLGFPLFFRLVLVRPLDDLVVGVRAVDAGNLQVSVPVHFADELGLVSESFNRMVASVRESDARLEGLVVERTQALAASEARYRELFATMTSGVVVVETEGRVQELNQAGERLEGITRAEVLNRPFWTVPPFAKNPALTELVQRAWETEPLTPLPLVRAQSKDGWREASAYRLPSNEVVVVFDDVTARIEAQTRQQQVAALEERERIGRELHDDLGQVMGYVNIQAQTARTLLRQGQLGGATAILDQLVSVAQKAHEDVRQHILGIRTASDASPQDFQTALRRYLEQLEQRYGLRTLVSWPQDQLSSSLAREVETQLLRIIQEALTNVRTHAGVLTARLTFMVNQDSVQVIISDEGQGFAAPEGGGQGRASSAASAPGPGEELPALAQAHFGLEIMRERAEAVGGTIEVRSAPGQGTQVIARLPRLLETTIGEDVRGLRVLLVDDHRLYLDGLRNMLSVRGVQVVGLAYDGLEAQAMARTLHPDLILMDVEMPRCNGLEATRQIKAGLPDIKIVMLTVAAEDEILLEALKAGASGYLLKNLDSNQFFTLLGEVLRGETVLSPTLAACVLRAFAEGSLPPEAAAEATDETTLAPHLRPRQQEVLALLMEGQSNREIAEALHISERTVKYHVKEILAQLQLKSRYELIHAVRK